MHEKRDENLRDNVHCCSGNYDFLCPIQTIKRRETVFKNITLACGLLIVLMALALGTAGVVYSDSYTWLKLLVVGIAVLTGAVYCAIFAAVMKEDNYD